MSTNSSLSELLEEQKENVELDLSPDVLNKMKGTFDPGDKIKIVWAGDVLDGEEDEGYLFQIPTCDEDVDMLDFFVHIPRPKNPSGKENAPSVFVHFVSLLTNKLVKQIIKIN